MKCKESKSNVSLWNCGVRVSLGCQEMERATFSDHLIAQADASPLAEHSRIKLKPLGYRIRSSEMN